MSADEIVDVVDENDRFLYSISRSETVTRKLRCRIVHSFLIERASQEVLLLIRSRNSSFCPLHYGAVGGYVQSGETFDQAVRREIAEEVGITVEPIFLEKHPQHDPETGLYFIDAVYAAFINRADVVLDPEAVEDVIYMPFAELVALDPETALMHPLLANQIAVLSQHFDRLVA